MSDDYIPPKPPQIPDRIKRIAATLLSSMVKLVVDEALKSGAEKLGVTQSDVEDTKRHIDASSKEIIIKADYTKNNGS